MDQTTHELRLSNWKAIIDSCQARPDGQTARQWLTENNVPEKQYYYWLRRLRRQACVELKPAPAGLEPPALGFAEFSARELLPEPSAAAPSQAVPMITIRTKHSTIEISSAVSETLAVRLIKAVAHAL
jgi:putative transposase